MEEELILIGLISQNFRIWKIVLNDDKIDSVKKQSLHDDEDFSEKQIWFDWSEEHWNGRMEWSCNIFDWRQIWQFDMFHVIYWKVQNTFNWEIIAIGAEIWQSRNYLNSWIPKRQ